MSTKVTLLPGDGIGPEVADAVRKILAAAGADIEWEVIMTPPKGVFPFEEAVASVRRNRVALKGPMMTGGGLGPPSINVALRRELSLFANLRPVRSVEGVQTRWSGVDLVVVRENTEDLYSGLEHTAWSWGVVESLKIITEKASTDIAQYAFAYARRHNRKMVHAIHKANIMASSPGRRLFHLRLCARSLRSIPKSNTTR